MFHCINISKRIKPNPYAIAFDPLHFIFSFFSLEMYFLPPVLVPLAFPHIADRRFISRALNMIFPSILCYNKRIIYNMKRFQDKVCIVTASASGIGFAIARKLGQEGGKLIISSRNSSHVSSALENLRKEGITCEGIVCHVAKDRKKLINFAIEKFGGIDILVNNAAVSTTFGPTIDTTEEAYDKMLDINVKAPFFLLKEALPHLKRSQGKVIFVASIVGYRPSSVVGIYSMTKAALINLTRNLGAELAGSKVRVNAIAPGIIKTKFAQDLAESEDVKTNPSGRIGLPEDCAGAVAYLCSNEADYVVGETIVIAGGFHARL